MTLSIVKKCWESRMLRKLHVRFGVGVRGQFPGLHHKGYTHSLTQWRQVIDALRYLRDEKGMTIVMIAHTKIEKFTDPESLTFDRFSPRLHKQAAALLGEWVDAILLATRAHSAAKGEKGGDRILRCVGGPAHIAKNRYDLPETLPLDWNAVMNCIIQAKTED